MTADRLFDFANTLALVGWFLIILFPRHRIGTNWVAPVVIPALLASAYIILLVRFLNPAAFANFSSLAGIMALQANGGSWLTLAGWLHYLAFDLFIGSWQVRTARDEGIPHLAIVPSLLLTFMAGPFGLLTFFITRFALKRRIAIEGLFFKAS